MPLIAGRWTYLILLVLSPTYSVTTQHRQVQYFGGGNLEDFLSRGERWIFPAPTDEVQELRRFKRFTESRPSNVPSVASIIDSPNQRTQGRPPVVVLDRVNQPPTREEILWRKIAELREQNRNNPTAPATQTRGNPVASAPAQSRLPAGHPHHTQSRPNGFSLTQSAGTVVINDQDLTSTFDRCGQYLEHCLGHVPGHIHGHQHTHHGSSPNGRTGTGGVRHTPVSFSPGHNHQHNPTFMNFNGQQIPVWPG